MTTNKVKDYGDLRVTMTSDYTFVWEDRNSGALRDVALWDPVPQGNLYPLGTHAEPNWDNINGRRASLLVGQNPNTNPSKKAVARPVSYTLIWTDQGSGATLDGSFWRPVPPLGYVALGDVAGKGWSMPSVEKVWCVREDLVGYGKFLATSVWDDAHSGVNTDVSVWAIMADSLGIDGSDRIPIVADTFRAQQNYERPSSNAARILLLNVGKTYNSFDVAAPKVTPDKIPMRGQQYDLTEQAKVTLPFHCFLKPTDQSSLDNIRDPFLTVSRWIAWYVEGVWVNDTNGAFTRQTILKYGVSQTQQEQMTNSVGLEVSASYGIELANTSISLNYQFTQSSSTSFTEFSEKTVTETIDVPAHNATVLFSKHIWMKGARADGAVVIHSMEIVANDDVYYAGCELPTT
ncbi:hypothetical protein DL771_002048 [Monosporascus sp. 5C6A]|nr:hypothetical protein DL771_002048 [Monosporascus sp. 5C6A]